MEPFSGVDRLVGVYDADGGVLGEVRYALGKVLSDAHCALCDLTHRGLKRRAAWNALVERLGLPVDLLHRNEMDERAQRAATDGLPCILVDRDTRLEGLLGPDELARCGTDLEELERRIRAALASRS